MGPTVACGPRICARHTSVAEIERRCTEGNTIQHKDSREGRVAHSGVNEHCGRNPSKLTSDANYLLAGSNAVRVYVAGGKIRSRDDVTYFLTWIDKLTTLTDAWPWWRSPAEKKSIRRSPRRLSPPRRGSPTQAVAVHEIVSKTHGLK